MPKLGLTMVDGTVVDWYKEEGDSVKKSEPVLEIETEKLTYSVESPANGVLLKKLANVGDKYPVTAVVGYIGHPGEAVPDISGSASVKTEAAQVSVAAPAVAVTIPAAVAGRVFISPVAKKIAAQMGIDYRQIKGTGPNGRIVKADVLNYSKSRFADVTPDEPGTVIPYTGMRRAIGETMLRSWMTIPMVTHHVNADCGALLEYRAMLNAGVEDKNERVSIGELMLKLTAAALAVSPVINSSMTPEGIVLHKQVHLGMATALSDGLLAPVIRNADRKSLLTISREAKDLAARAKSGTLLPDDLKGGTFTVSNLGGYGSVDFFTPIINPPQAAILGIGRIVETAIPVGGEIKVRPMIGLSLTYDHRIIDGAVAAEFTKILMKFLENPARAVL